MANVRVASQPGITQDILGHLVATASRAPSIHNSQPWRFHLAGEVLEMRADPGRAMQISDPAARELVVSCGAALYNIRLALRHRSLIARIDTTPDPADPLLLARITGERGSEPTAEELRLLGAVIRRHTHRHGFDVVPLAPSLAVALEADAAAEGCELRWIDAPEQITAVVEFALLADRIQVGDPAWETEISQWVDHGSDRRDGIPAKAVSPVPPLRGATDRLPARRFLPDRRAGTQDTGPGSAGRIAILLTDGDRVGDWLAAGQALQRILLRAADVWVFATFATTTLEIPHLRKALSDTLGLRAFPQMILELGHAGYAYTTRRLPTQDRIDD